MGASFILATQALGQLDAISDKLRPAIMSNTATLFVFQTSADDADLLRHELDDAVTQTDIINLQDYNCYTKAQVGHARLPVMHVETLPPAKDDPTVVEKVIGQMARYTRPADVAESERRQFQDQWYGQEMQDLRAVIKNKGQKAKNELARARNNARKGGRDSGVSNPAPSQNAKDSGTTPPADKSDAKDKGTETQEAHDDPHANP